MNILVTGSNGQLGNELRLLEASHTQHTFINTDIDELNVTDIKAVEAFVKENNIDGIINCAAYTAVDKAERDVNKAYELNAMAPGRMGYVIEKRGGWIIQISTDYVFDGMANTPYTEDCRPCPLTVYGTTKREGENCAMAACSHALIIRTAWLYSSFGNNFVKTMIRLGRERDTLGVVFDQVGTPTNAGDLAAVIMHIVESGKLGTETCSSAVFHYSNEGVCSWYDFAKAIHRLAGITDCCVSPIRTADYRTPARRPAYSVLDKTKIKQTFGINIPYWEESLASLIQHNL